MADSHPFANAGLDMFGAQRSFVNSAMQTHFENPAVGVALGGLLESMIEPDGPWKEIAKRLREAGAVKPQGTPQAAPAAVPPVAPIPPVTPVVQAAPAVTATPAEDGAAPSAINYLPKPFMQPR